MRLVSVRIRDFRSIEDSGQFSLGPVTCLVGKNESGKTAILKALQKLNPDNPSKESFIPSQDYPKKKWRPDTPIPDDPATVESTWELNPVDMEELELTFGEGAIPLKQFSMSMGFDNVRQFSVVLDEQKILDHFLPKTTLSSADIEPLSTADSINSLHQLLSGLKTRSEPQENLLRELIQTFPKAAGLR